MKTKHADDMVQSAIRLPESLHERLKKAGGERGMGDQIRRRLEASFDAEKARANPKMSYLLDSISACAEEIARDYGNWSEDPFAFEVLKGCVNLLLTHFQPKGDPIPHPTAGNVIALLFGPEQSPNSQELSRMYVHSWISFGLAGEDEKRL